MFNLNFTNDPFTYRAINAVFTAVGIGLIATLTPLGIGAGVFFVCVSFPDCFGYFTSDEFVELGWEDDPEDVS